LSGALLVPLIIRTPETVKKGGKVVNSPVSLMDVGPTLVELSGGKLDYIQFGRSLCPILQGETDRVREYVLSEYLGEIMYMDDQWKMVINCHGQVYLLFDRVNDPLEQRNLAGAPEFAEVAAVLREKMMLALAENRCLKPSVLQIPRS
jgi:arylsulfatase A-like enzyme